MRRKIPAVYVFDAKERTFEEYFDMILDRVDFSLNFDGPKDHVYGVDYTKNIRIELPKRSGDIFYDSYHDRYVTFLFEPDSKKAIDILLDYVISKASIEICYHERGLDEARKRYQSLVDIKRELLPKETSLD